MKKEFLHWAFLLVAGIALTACGGDDAADSLTPSTPSTPSSPAGKWSVTIKAGVDETRGLSLDGSTLKVNWSTSETVFAYYDDVKVGELHPTAASSNADVTLQGDLDTQNYTAGQSLTLKFPRETKDFTGQAGTLEDIAAKYDYLEATATISSVDAATRSMTIASTTFRVQQSIARLTFTQALQSGDVITITGAANSTAVSVTLASAVTAGDPVFVALPLTTSATTYTLNFTVTRSGSTVYEGSLSNKALQNNKYYAATVTLDREGVKLWENGPYWATMNVGAESETDYGDFFAWGGTTGYSSVYADPMTDHNFSWENCPYRTSGTTNSDVKFSKYVPTGSSSYWGGSGDVDNKTTLEAADDAASANWGGSWRMPTEAEFSDLLSKTTLTWQTNYKGVSGLNGYLFTGKDSYSGKSIFFPAAGGRYGTSLYGQGSYGGYWLSSLNTPPLYGRYLMFHSGDAYVSGDDRCSGQSVRPVHD